MSYNDFCWPSVQMLQTFNALDDLLTLPTSSTFDPKLLLRNGKSVRIQIVLWSGDQWLLSPASSASLLLSNSIEDMHSFGSYIHELQYCLAHFGQERVDDLQANFFCMNLEPIVFLTRLTYLMTSGSLEFYYVIV